MSKGSTIGCPTTKTLCNISNLLLQTEPADLEAKTEQETFLATEAHVDSLDKEKGTMTQVLEDRNNVIKSNTMELQQLRINCSIMKERNSQLSHKHNDVWMELVSCKSTLKLFENVLGCKDNLIKQMKSKNKGRVGTLKCLHCGKEMGAHKCDKAATFFEANKGYNKSSLGASTDKPVPDKEKVDKERFCLGKQSDEEAEASDDEDVFELDDAKFPISLLHDEKGNSFLKARRRRRSFGRPQQQLELLRSRAEELAMESISGDMPMKRLCDISNLLPQTEPANQEAKPKQLTSSVDLLVKETRNLTLVVEDKNNIIQSNEIELQQLRTEWQDLQKQNSQLAQRYRNSWKQLVSFKNKLLVLGHMLRCRDGLLRAIKSETDEGKVTTSTCLHCEKQIRAHRCHEAGKYFEADNYGNMNKSSLPVQAKGKKVNYRRFVSKGKKK